MNDLLLKYRQLDSFRKRELLDFLEFLLHKQKKKKSPIGGSSYEERLLQVSVWSEEEVSELESEVKKGNLWEVQNR